MNGSEHSLVVSGSIPDELSCLWSVCDVTFHFPLLCDVYIQPTPFNCAPEAFMVFVGLKTLQPVSEVTRKISATCH